MSIATTEITSVKSNNDPGAFIDAFLLKTHTTNNYVYYYFSLYTSHGDVIKWKHFPRSWPFVRGIHRSPVNSPHESQWRRALMFSLICLNERLNKQSWSWWFETPSRPLWRHSNADYFLVLFLSTAPSTGYSGISKVVHLAFIVNTWIKQTRPYDCMFHKEKSLDWELTERVNKHLVAFLTAAFMLGHL